jgi:hypothetical protein
MSVSNLVKYPPAEQSLALSAGGTIVAGSYATGTQPLTLVWQGAVLTGAGGTSTLTWTYSAGAPHLFKAGDFCVSNKIAGATLNGSTAVLTPSATATTDTIVASSSAEASTIFVQVFRAVNAYQY